MPYERKNHRTRRCSYCSRSFWTTAREMAFHREICKDPPPSCSAPQSEADAWLARHRRDAA